MLQNSLINYYLLFKLLIYTYLNIIFGTYLFYKEKVYQKYLSLEINISNMTGVKLRTIAKHFWFKNLFLRFQSRKKSWPLDLNSHVIMWTKSHECIIKHANRTT